MVIYDSGYGMMGMMYQYGGFMWLWSLFGFLLFLGLVVLVWLLIMKVWKDINKRNK